jgi:hypothetical protein
VFTKHCSEEAHEESQQSAVSDCRHEETNQLGQCCKATESPRNKRGFAAFTLHMSAKIADIYKQEFDWRNIECLSK